MEGPGVGGPLGTLAALGALPHHGFVSGINIVSGSSGRAFLYPGTSFDCLNLLA